jgi:DNA-binding response OmpR family regulator
MSATLTLLVVEDDENDFHFINSALRKSPVRVRVHWARDGAEARDYLAGEGEFTDRRFFPLPDIVVLDLKMPRFNGFDLIRWVRQHPEHAMLPLLVLSSSDYGPDIENAYALGATTYFVKPMDLDQFVALFRSIAEYWSRGLSAVRQLRSTKTSTAV